MEGFLEKTFHFSSFLGIQKKIIEDILMEKDCLVICPTGAGKTLCFQFPPLFSQKCYVVISPLLALIKEQVGKLRAKGIPVFLYCSDVSEGEKNDVLRHLKGETVSTFILYTTMESLMTTQLSAVVQHLIDGKQFGGFVFDEAHTVVDYRFRAMYEHANMRNKFSGKYSISAFTASADAVYQGAICGKLGMRDITIHRQALDRPNITPYFINVLPAQRLEYAKKWLKSLFGDVLPCGIVYCATHTLCSSTAKKLEVAFKTPFLVYHAGLSREEREQVYQQWIDGKGVVVASGALGMGIDNQNTRFVINYDPSKNVNELYQNMGRAGRDGAQAYYMMFSHMNLINAIGSMFPEEPATNIITMRKVCAKAMEGVCARKRILTYLAPLEARDVICGSTARKCLACQPCTELGVMSSTPVKKNITKNKKKK